MHSVRDLSTWGCVKGCIFSAIIEQSMSSRLGDLDAAMALTMILMMMTNLMIAMLMMMMTTISTHTSQSQRKKKGSEKKTYSLIHPHSIKTSDCVGLMSAVSFQHAKGDNWI